MICAVVDQKTGRVVNTIVANPEWDDPAPGTILVVVEADALKGAPVDDRWLYDSERGIFEPTPELAAQKTEEARIAAEKEAVREEHRKSQSEDVKR